ncbi:MAG: efflux RND transporter periplasmic adaptor subunit [Candidatus Omnitrophota bacterium]
MSSKLKIILLLLFFFLGGLALGYFANRPKPKVVLEKKAAVNGFVVKAVTVQKEDFTLFMDYVGSLKAKDEAGVFSKVTGKLVEYSVNEGDSVEKGQVIANIDRDEAGLKFEIAKVESPLSGVVGRILMDKGAAIEPNKDVLAIIADMDEMSLKLDIPEQDIPFLKRGLKALIRVDAYPDEEFQGEVFRVAEMVDPQTRTLPIEVRISNKERKLKSGMFARIKIIAARLKDVLVLSQDAIVQELGEKFVFRVENNTADKRKVSLGKRDNGKIEVISGIREGDTVIVFGQQGLKDGARVTVSKE